jgi:hypothetical protein
MCPGLAGSGNNLGPGSEFKEPINFITQPNVPTNFQKNFVENKELKENKDTQKNLKHHEIRRIRHENNEIDQVTIRIRDKSAEKPDIHANNSRETENTLKNKENQSKELRESQPRVKFDLSEKQLREVQRIPRKQSPDPPAKRVSFKDDKLENEITKSPKDHRGNKDCNLITENNELPLQHELLQTNMRIENQILKTLIDSGSQKNFISQEVLKKMNIPVKVNELPSNKTFFAKSFNGERSLISKYIECTLTHESGAVFEKTRLYCSPLSFDILLGKPWHTEYNPDIDWKSNTVKLNDISFVAIQWRPP